MDIKGKVDRSELREIKAFLSENIRTDWHFSPDAGSLYSQQASVALAYRERYYGTTSDSDNQANNKKGGKEKSRNGDAGADSYRFDSPDAVASAVEQRREQRKRKRRQLLEEEMETNDGLRFFVKRRNAWTGARRPPSLAHANPSNDAASADQKRTDSGFSSSSSSALPPTTTTTCSSSSSSSSSSSPTAPPPPQSLADLLAPAPLLPLAAPLVPRTHPLRAATQDAKNDGELYGKIVQAARTPSVPVGLADMTRALVHGWRAAGEWPPKPGAPEPAVGRRKGASAAGGAGRGEARGAARVLRIFGGGGGKGEEGSDGDGDVRMNGRDAAPQSPVKRGMQSVRKVFRLSGGAAGSGYGEAG